MRLRAKWVDFNRSVRVEVIHIRRWFPAVVVAGLGAMTTAPGISLSADEGKPVETVTISAGKLKVVLHDNRQPPNIRDDHYPWSGVRSLFHEQDAPEFNAFSPTGLNFEHIISGHKNSNNSFTPRSGKYALMPLPGGKSARLVRNKEDEPWAMSSTLTYTLTEPHSIDADFRCVAHDRSRFGKRGYAILFFANYMNDVEDIALNFWGVEGPKLQEKWVKADAPKGHADWNQGGTYRSLPAAELAYDADHDFKLSSWSYDYPRFTKPFYYGLAGKGMVLILMFNKMHSDEDEIRFSIFKFSVRPQARRPAWDFAYVIRKLEEKKEYGFKARLVWKKFVSPDDCLKEYETWAASVGKER
jgi:hypothetical protein